MMELVLGVKLGRKDFPKTLSLKPKAVEFHTESEDLTEHFDTMKKISENITLPKSVHAPHTVENTAFNLRKHIDLVTKCAELGDLLIIHPSIELGKGHSKMLEDFTDSLSLLENLDVKVAIENMPDWHTGKKPHERFVIGKYIDDFKEIFSKWPDYGLCFDVCHAAMLNQDIESWFRELGKKIFHLHFADSKKGIEGLQIGEGDIDWKAVFRWAREYCSGRIVVIPEVIGGHKKGAEGFRVALERLKVLNRG